MATANQSTTVALPHTISTGVLQPNSPVKSRLKPIFIGPNGVRAGWRLLIFFLLLSIPATALFIMSHNQTAPSTPQTITPFLLSASDAITLAILAGAAFLMGKIERRKFREYGLPLTQAFRREFWIGTLIGFSTITGTLFTLFLLHAYRVSGLALHGAAICSSLAAWAGTFLLVGLFEEFAFRGYVQFTLGSGIGFWPAATLLSALFGLGHLIADPNETLIGSTAVVLFGLLLSFFLRKTGTLWCAVGFHAAYDWGQTFFYGVPDSGITPYHNLLHSVMSGPAWLTGGIVGPEASIVTPVALLIAALLFGRYYRSRRSHAGQTLPTQTVIS
ncbi:MAG TPA: CPBP family intramembrane glutamic endopeptidase [Candidatus Acidoferrales bacterium]|nr:CPBP family intramembrane glutamic endopeptidase [Candidatus Acidoferrales bacterium]